MDFVVALLVRSIVGMTKFMTITQAQVNTLTVSREKMKKCKAVVEQQESSTRTLNFRVNGSYNKSWVLTRDRRGCPAAQGRVLSLRRRRGQTDAVPRH